MYFLFFFFQAEDGIRDSSVTGVQTCALPISYVLDTGEKLTTTLMTGAELAAAKVVVGEPVDAAAQVVVIPFPPVKAGQSIRLPISEPYTAPTSYRLEADQLGFDPPLAPPPHPALLPAA